MRKNVFRILTTGVTLILMAMIFFFSTEPAEASDSTSGIISQRVADIIRPGWRGMEEEARLAFYNEVQFAVRKTAHFTEFFLLGASMFLCLESWTGGRKRNPPLAWAGAAAWALLDEIHQGTVTGRSRQFADVLLDSTGAAFGVLTAYLILNAVRDRVHRLHDQKSG